jgi:hypothetical protein
MFSKFASLRADRPLKSRWFGAGAVIVSGAVVAVLGAGGVATASSSPAGAKADTTTTGTIKACYKTSTSPSTISHVPTSATCPSGNTTLTWNQVGPRGPQGPAGPQGVAGAQGPAGPKGPTGSQGSAGISVGTSGLRGTAVPLNQAQTLKTVLTGAAVPTDGTYYINASVMVVVAQGDTVACILADTGLQTVDTGAFATVGPVANQTYETLPLSGAIGMFAGDTPEVQCTDYTSSNVSSFYDGGITSVLISSPTGNAATHAAKRHLSPSLPSHL